MKIKSGYYFAFSMLLAASGCTTTSPSAVVSSDGELKQDYTAKSRDLNKQLRAEWVQIDARSGKECPAVPKSETQSAAFDKVVTIDALKSCLAQHSWLVSERWAQKFMEGDVNSPWGPYFMSLVAEGKNEISRAQWMIDLAIARAPQVGGLSYQKAHLYWKSDQPREALAWASRAIELDSRFAPAYFLAGHIRYRDHEWKEALNAFQAAIGEGMKDANLFFETAECAMMLKEKTVALENYQNAVKAGSKLIGIKEKISALEKEFAIQRAVASDAVQKAAAVQEKKNEK